MFAEPKSRNNPLLSIIFHPWHWIHSYDTLIDDTLEITELKNINIVSKAAVLFNWISGTLIINFLKWSTQVIYAGGLQRLSLTRLVNAWIQIDEKNQFKLRT